MPLKLIYQNSSVPLKLIYHSSSVPLKLIYQGSFVPLKFIYQSSSVQLKLILLRIGQENQNTELMIKLSTLSRPMVCPEALMAQMMAPFTV